jgi:hypothetical protein
MTHDLVEVEELMNTLHAGSEKEKSHTRTVALVLTLLGCVMVKWKPHSCIATGDAMVMRRSSRMGGLSCLAHRGHCSLIS